MLAQLLGRGLLYGGPDDTQQGFGQSLFDLEQELLPRFQTGGCTGLDRGVADAQLRETIAADSVYGGAQHLSRFEQAQQRSVWLGVLSSSGCSALGIFMPLRGSMVSNISAGDRQNPMC